MNKQVAKSDNKLQTSVTAWGAGESIDKQDILIPKINLLQPLSELVQDNKAKAGEFVENVNQTVLGKKVTFLAFGHFKTLQVWENHKWKKTISWEPQFQELPFEQLVSGVVTHNVKVLNYYVLLPSELAKGIAFPYVLPFKKTGTRAGKKLATIFTKLKLFKAPSAAKVFTLTASLTENDKGKFWVPDVMEIRNSSAEEVAAAKKWHDGLTTAKVQVKEDEEDVK